MDDTGEDSKYPPNYGLNQGYGSSQHPKASVHNVPYVQSQQIVKYVDEDDDEVEEDDEEEEEQEQEERNAGDDEMNGAIQKNGDDDNDNDNQYDDINMNDDDDGENHNGRNDTVSLQRHPKKRKLKSLLSSYEFAPRVPPPTMAPTSTAKPSFGGRNTLTDWSEHETFVLLEAWGDRFLQCGRKSLRSEEWQEVADRVSQDSKIERTDSQCRNRLDTLKKKYKKEKANLERSRSVNTKWVYFKKMDMLLSSNPHQTGLSRGVDSGENAFLNPSANGVDEMRDSAGNSDSQDDDDDDSDLVPPKKSKSKADRSGGVSFKLLADSINKFSEIYEKIENSKIQQMIELEKMRMDFHRDLELQKRQILDRVQAEITKARQGDYEDNDVSAENIGG
ncbi:trihelix transcription factor ASIL2-like [Cynara cardunculus var. scolymus]|uniref:Myb-like domain-containing protein n=1 Tax=Cynara cardunculus var. scolymus TaxID=59895 RepID=A0A118K3I6_CYNCS|nr:trihelix transcription factor ASIL2-like [Cynara cardunculus var. scolymus]KVI05998.1 Myb-like domain-containing protein [Cynara cardunculus var. scolymus]